jgi:hypothetical protein
MDQADLDRRFNYHQPPDQETINRHANIRRACQDAAEAVNINAPEGREKSVAITKLEEAMMWANAAIARGHGG